MSLTNQEKLQRLITLMYDFNIHVTKNKRFSFTNKVTAYRVTWCTNAFAVKGILQEKGLIQQRTGYIYKYTEHGQDWNVKQFAEFLLTEIDSNRNYLNKVEGDLDFDTLGEKPLSYEEIVKLHNGQKSTVDKPQHKFPKVNLANIEQGKFVDVNCCKCDLKIRIYKNGVRCYYAENGSVTPHNPKPCIVVIKETPVEQIESQKSEEVTTIIPLVHPESNELLIIKNNLNDNIEERLKADLKDALMLIRVLYEDMIINNIVTSGRKMAGRFLYCNGYEEIVKKLEKTNA